MIGTARFDEIGEAFREGYRQYEEALSSVDGGKFQVSEEYGGAAENRIAVGDNLRYMAYLLREGAMEGKIQLIYVDPPFFPTANTRRPSGCAPKSWGHQRC